MLAIDYEGAKRVAIGLIGLCIVLSFVTAVIIRNVTTKIVSTLLMVGVALGVLTQRTTLQDCAELARANARVGSTTALTCTFFGADVTILDSDPSTG